MTILWDSDPAAAENYHFAVGDHIEVVESAQSVMRGLGANAAELLVIVGPEVGLQAASAIAEQGRASVVTKHESGLDTVCAPSQPGEADRISGPLVGEMLRVARRCYEYIIIDTPPAFSEHVLAAFDVCDMAVLLATLDIPAVKNLRLTLDTLDLLGHPRDAWIVILNRSDAKVGLNAE